MTNKSEPRYIIFDTDMGSDDSWALQMMLKAEKNLKNIKILAITAVNGNTTVKNVIKNTYRILDGAARTDVMYLNKKSWFNFFLVNSFEFISFCLTLFFAFRFQFIEVQLKV